MNAIKNLLILLILIPCSNLDCMDSEVFRVDFEEGGLIAKLKDIKSRLEDYEKQCIDASINQAELKTLRPRLTETIGLLDNLINNLPLENLSLKELNDVYGGLWDVSGNVDTDNLRDTLAKMRKIARSALSPRVILDSKALKGIIAFFAFVIVLISYFLYCSSHEGKGICAMHDNDTAPRRY